MKVIAYARPDGGVSIIAPAPGAMLEGEDEKTFLQRIVEKDVPRNAARVTILDAAHLPDREFRNAWRLSEGKIGHDLDHARDIAKQRLRDWRAPLLAALDAQAFRADESGDANEKKAVISRKQQLRDITAHPDIASAVSVEALSGALSAVKADAPTT